MGYIYKLTNTVNRKAYIGQTIKKVEKRINQHFNPNDKRCPALNNAIQKYGHDAFTVEILHEALDILLDDLEIAEINKHNTIAPHGYNLQSGGNAGGTNRVVSDQTRMKMSEANKRRKPPSLETRKKMSESQKGKTLSPEARENISKSNKRRKGKPLSAEHRKKISEAGKGRTHTPEARKKISDGNKGKTRTPEIRKKLSEINKGKTLSPEIRKKISDGHKGKTFTPEHRRKMSEAAKRRKPPSLETRRKLSLNRAHPERASAYEILNSLPESMPLAERRKHLLKKFPKVSEGTVRYWVKTWYKTSP